MAIVPYLYFMTSYKVAFSVIFISLFAVSCTWRHHVYKRAKKESHISRRSSNAAKGAVHQQRGGDASSTEKQKAKVHHKGGGAKFKFY